MASNNNNFQYNGRQFAKDSYQVAKKGYNVAQRMNPFAIIKVTIIIVVILLAVIFGKTIVEKFKSMLGVSGSIWDMFSGGSETGGKDSKKDGYNEELKKEGQKEAKEEIKNLKHVPVSWYTKYLIPKNVKKDSRKIIDDLFDAFNGMNLPFYIDKEWSNKLNKLASMNKDEFRLIVRYWDATYYAEGTLYDFVKSQNQLNTSYDGSTVSAFLNKLESFGLKGKCPKLK